ncbi:protein HyxA, partial [Escherichia coli]|nr:protein HyxA [Escherichia coli]EMB9718135.1 protein HyxA [Escherichia coli]
IANTSGGFSGLKHAEILPVMDSYSVFMKEVNNRTKTIVMSERFPEKQKKVLSLLLAGHSWEYSAQFLKTGIRQIWLAEQSLKKRWGIPDSMSLREALLLSSNKFHGDGNALEKTNAMTLRENGNTNRYSVVVNAGTQALSLHKYK